MTVLVILTKGIFSSSGRGKGEDYPTGITIFGRRQTGAKQHSWIGVNDGARLPSTSRTLMAASVPAQEEGKLLSEALSTVKVQVQQMKRHLVRPHSLHNISHLKWSFRNWTN